MDDFSLEVIVTNAFSCGLLIRIRRGSRVPVGYFLVPCSKFGWGFVSGGGGGGAPWTKLKIRPNILNSGQFWSFLTSQMWCHW